ncbi:Glycerol uptake protein 1 [Candida viswanathii]|uniref:Glycerol uptake protein 1 n=1 Tax=Candida viswanathii TaxID=5486 RepID=A0A367YEX8_9ASCO|nr:Glycerol uptake protein 1 [Candida viswanathii]
MSYLTDLLKLFSLETLDTRLYPSSNTTKRQSIIKRANPQSRWSTLEFKFYYLVFLVVVPLMFKAGMDSANENNPNYPKFEHLLSPGWIFGRKVDNSDQQYRFFRNNFPLLCLLIVIHVGLRKALVKFVPQTKRTYFDFVFGVVFLIGAHGVNVLKLAVHLLINYAIGKYIKNYKVALWTTWIYGVSSLFLNEWYGSYTLGFGFFETGFTGIIPRWDVFYNFTLLRMISFNYDYLEREQTLTNMTKTPREEQNGSLLNLDDRQRLTAPLPLEDYSFFNYISYLTYTPLFIAGPILTFNDYIYQSDYQQSASTKDLHRIFLYLIRFIFCLLTLEFILHFMYVVAASKAKAWAGDSPFQISMLGMFNLNIIWLKLLIPWRLFRLWALLDGIDPPENMIRCMDNNFSALAFWRAWHRSYNRWIIRYIYVPMGGGGKYRIINSLLVFSFVAIWHDIELKLLMWGWLVVVFLIPEITATMIFKKYNGEWWYRHLCGVGAVVNIWMMMIANLVGFCLGTDGMWKLLHDLFKTFDGVRFFVVSSFALFVGAQIMFEIRESEMRKGIDVRC